MSTGSPLNPPPARGGRDGKLPAYVSNGVIGLRVREAPLFPGMALINGVAGQHPERRIEAAAPCPYPLSGDIGVDGAWMREEPWGVSGLVQEYDFARGELISRFNLRLAGRSLQVEVLTFASRTAPSLVLQEVTVRCDEACDLKIRASVEPADARGQIVRRRTSTPGEPEPTADASMLWEPEGALSQCGYAMATELSVQGEKAVADWDPQGPLRTTWSVRGRGGRPLRMRQMVAVLPSILHQRPDEEAVRRVAHARKTGFDALRRRNQSAWAELWRSRVVARGAETKHQALIDAAFFYLNSSTHPASPASTSIFGLATWRDYHYYFGHVMWDIDAFCVPPLILFQPQAARALLDFRTRGISAAADNARLSDRQGLQFPWEAAPMSGQEAAPGGGEAAHHEDHVSLHVARAFALYADVTGDDAFRQERAWPIVSDVADWLVSRATRTSRGFELKRAMGPAEVPEPPDNDAFTLMAGADVLRRAIRMAQELGRPVPQSWGDMLEGLYLPVRADNVIASHDDFRRDQAKGATPSPLAGLFPCDYPATEAQKRRTLAFFLEAWRDYVGAPMFPAFYTAWAAMAGDRDLALKLFEEGYAAYDAGRFHQCLEYRPDHPDSETPAGPFFANLGGLLLALTYGLTGLSIDGGQPSDWARRPVVLPSGWEAIKIERIWIRGRPAKLTATQGAERAQLDYLDE